MTGRSRAWLVSSGALLLFLELAIPDHSFIGAVLGVVSRALTSIVSG